MPAPRPIPCRRMRNGSLRLRRRLLRQAIRDRGGETTILKTISSILKPKRGEIFFEGIPIYRMEPYKIIETGIIPVPEARRLFAEMTVEENLDMGALKGGAKAERKKTKEIVCDIFPRLRERKRQLAGTLSGGEQQMLAFQRVLFNFPQTGQDGSLSTVMESALPARPSQRKSRPASGSP